jgi:hypothetical protein
MLTTALRPRSATEIVDASFRLCREHYGALATATIVIFAPALVIGLLLPADNTYIRTLLQNLLTPVADGAAIAIVSGAYLGRDVDASTGLRALGGRVGPLIWASIMRNLLVIMGIFLLVIPGFIALAWTFAMPMAIILEGKSAGDSFSRARELAKGHVLRILGTLLLMLLIFFVIVITLGAAIGAIGAMLGIGARAMTAIEELLFILPYPLLSVTGTLLYYDLRIRKEGFDIDIMAQELAGVSSSASSAVAVSTGR